MNRRIYVAAPSEKAWRKQRFLLWFGACAPTYVLAYGTLDTALETAAELLAAEGMHGLITTHDKPAEELGCDCTDPFECESHTYTEAGWLTADEWGISIENPTREQLIDMFGGAR